MRDFLFIRHGETDWNLADRMQGQIQNVPLNETGIKQSIGAVSHLNEAAPDLIISSTLDRAAATARIIGERLGLSVLYDARLIERNWGAAEGLTYKEINAADPKIFFTNDGKQDWISKTRQPKGSETREALAERAFAAVLDLLSRYNEQRLLLVTHGAWLRALVHRLTESDQGFPNAVPYIAEENAGKWRIKPLG
jgi:broad specificity phosphatase PhoE